MEGSGGDPSWISVAKPDGPFGKCAGRVPGSDTMGRLKTRRGRSVTRSLIMREKRGPILAWTKALKMTKGAVLMILGDSRRALGGFFPRKEWANSRGETSRGHVGGDEPSKLRVRTKPLKDEPHERHLPENGRTGERGTRPLRG